MGPAAGGSGCSGGDGAACAEPGAVPGALRDDHRGQQCHARGGADRAASTERDAVGPAVQCRRPRRGELSPHRWPPPLCVEIETGLGAVVRAAQAAAARSPTVEEAPPPRWTLRRLVQWVEQQFGRRYCRETLRAALHRLKLSWKKAKKSLGRADPTKRQAFLERLQPVLDGAARDRHLLVYLDEAHIHQDADLGYGWSERGQRFWVHSTSPGLSAKRSFYGLYLYNEGQVRLWPYPRATGEHTITVLQRLRAEAAERRLIVLWDGASYHRAGIVRDAAAALDIQVLPLPSYSPDFMPVEALWRWLREDVTYHHCHASLDDLVSRVAEFQARINQDPIALADRLALKEHLNPTEERLRISN